MMMLATAIDFGAKASFKASTALFPIILRELYFEKVNDVVLRIAVPHTQPHPAVALVCVSITHPTATPVAWMWPVSFDKACFYT